MVQNSPYQDIANGSFEDEYDNVSAARAAKAVTVVITSGKEGQRITTHSHVRTYPESFMAALPKIEEPH